MGQSFPDVKRYSHSVFHLTVNLTIVAFRTKDMNSRREGFGTSHKTLSLIPGILSAGRQVRCKLGGYFDCLAPSEETLCSDASSTVLVTLNIAAFAPIPGASVRTATAARDRTLVGGQR
jgi:hypothetical protein